LIHQWQQLSEQQRLAIWIEDWRRLAQLVQAKELLKESIRLAIEAFDGETMDAPRHARRESLRVILQEAAKVDHQNCQLLEERCRRARTKLDELQTAAMDLRRVGRAYVAGTQTRWHSYL
jgi:hypothetical protein